MAIEPNAQARVAVYRLPLLILAFLALFAGVGAGLARLGWAVPEIAATAAAFHGPLLICGFFGVVISLERAVAIGRRWAYLGPLLGRAGRHRRNLGRGDGSGMALCGRKRRAAHRHARHFPPADRALHLHACRRVARVDRRHPALGNGRPAVHTIVDVVARVPDPDDCRRAARAFALPQAFAGCAR